MGGELDQRFRLAVIVGIGTLVLAACGSPEPSVVPFTPAAVPSASDEGTDGAVVARDAFLALMADPELTFRVESELKAGAENAEGLVAFRLVGIHDATPTDYAEHAQIAGHLFGDSSTNFQLLSIGRTSHVLDQAGIAGWTEVVASDDAYRPNAIVGLAEEDLRFVGETSDGLLEFDVVPWIFGDPIGATAALGLVDDPALPQTTTTSHRTRLFTDDAGVPQHIVSDWTLEAGGEPAEGTLSQRFSSFGLYVSIRPPTGGSFAETSYDIDDDLDGDGEAEIHPWFDVAPEADADVAELELEILPPDEPFILGFEGAILFVRAHDEAQALILDQIVPFEGGSVRVPVGHQTVVAYYRTCDGWCGWLDAARTFCTAQAAFESGTRYRMVVRPDMTDAKCTVIPGS